MATDTPSSSSRLLRLPQELRQQIYKICLDKKVPHKVQFDHAITLVCRQTRLDSISILLKDTLYFCSLERLVQRIARCPPNLLGYVHDIFLRVDLDSPFDSEQTSLTYYNPFLSISQLRTLWLHMNLSHTSILDANQKLQKQETFLLAMAVSCPSLESLALDSSQLHLDYLTRLRNLRYLRWTGYSQSTPEETLCILGALPSLNSLSIHRSPTRTDKLTKHLSFTDYVLRNIKPLKCLELYHMISETKVDILTQNMMQALAPHRDTLYDLTIMSDS